MKLLLVEDDYDLAAGLNKALQAEGFVVVLARTGTEAVRQFKQFEPELVILDLGLPDMDGNQVLKTMRKQQHPCQILILTARDGVADKVQALDIGADDYLAKPFEMPELMARLRVMGRRLGTASSSVIEVGAVSMDVASHQVNVAGNVVELPRKEFLTLKVLMESVGRVKTREMLESQLYAWGATIGSNAIEVHISNLRKKLPKGFIKTIRGVGYTIQA